MTALSADGNPMLNVIAIGDFRLLFSGTALSLLGDQFALIATPWLVLQITGDPMMLGIVLALEGLPRAAFMLIGGAVSDRLSPRRLMIVADLIRLALTALMALAVLAGAVELWMIFGFALGFGTAAGFAVPAENSIVPLIVHRNDLQAGNSLMMGVGQIAGFVGPSLAGIIIGAYAGSLAGIGYAYAIDALSFAVSALCLLLITGARPVAGEGNGEGVFGSIYTAFAFVWNDGVMRLMFVMLAAINFLLIGPLLIGIPLLADTRLPEGAMAFGLLMSAFSVGNLCGFIAAGTLKRPGAARIRNILIAVMAGFGAVVMALGFIPWTGIDFVLLALLGLGNGYLAILLYTWMQNRTPHRMLGRVMSFLMFANTGLVPVSQAIAGALGKWNPTGMLVIAGSLAILVTVWVATRSELAAFSDSLAQPAASAAEGA